MCTKGGRLAVGTRAGIPERNLLFPLARPCLLVQPTSPALSPWKLAADFLLVGGRGGEGEGRADSSLLTPQF